MKQKIIITLLTLIALPCLIFSDDGGLTGEPDPAPVTTAPQDAALAMKELVRKHGQTCGSDIDQAVRMINGDTPAQAFTKATAFWARLGTKGKRTLKWITDLVATADAAAPAGTDYVPPSARAAIAKWTANPDNTVTVNP